MKSRAVVAAMAALMLVPGAAEAAPSEARYGVALRQNEPIVMEDGMTLRADVAVPADPQTGKPAAGRFPVVLTETAYGKDVAQLAAPFSGLLGSPGYFAERGFVQVLVDVRGTGASEGSWSFNPPIEARDSVRVIDWAAELPESNGRVGMIGASYLGITGLFAAGEVGPDSPLKAIFPIIASNSIFREAVMPGGLLDLEGIAMYLGLTAGTNTVGPVLGNRAEPAAALPALLGHAGGLLDFHVGTTLDALGNGPKAEDGTFWRARGPERVLDKIVANGIPAYLVGGFDDAFQSGVLRNYVGLQNAWAGRRTTLPMRSTQKVTGRYQALVGPWFHATVGAGGPDLDALALRWFDRWLKGERNGIEETRTPLRFIERDRSEHHERRFPVPDAPARTLRLTADGGLTEGASRGTSTLAFAGVSLPCTRSTQVWLLGLGEVVLQQLGLTDPCAQQAVPTLPEPAARSFTSAPVTRPTTIAGPLSAELTLTATTRDAELIAKVQDVAPDGTAKELTMGELLASHRATDEALSWRTRTGALLYPHHPITHAAKRPLTPGEPTELAIAIPPTVHTLKPGHRLRLVLTTGELPARFPLPVDLPNLLGGIYTLDLGASRLTVPVKDG